MGMDSVVYVPEEVLPLDSWSLIKVLRYDGISFHVFERVGLGLAEGYIDADIVAGAMCEVIEDVPYTAEDILDYLNKDFENPVSKAVSDIIVAVRDLRFLSDLYLALKDTSAVIVPDAYGLDSVLPDDYPYKPSDFVPLREWLEGRLRH